ncbi:hypothetical protein MAH4_14830 [Sessilibacter sp. MAH4]
MESFGKWFECDETIDLKLENGIEVSIDEFIAKQPRYSFDKSVYANPCSHADTRLHYK